MNEQSFCLLPFPSDEPPSDIKISGSVFRNFNTLTINYVLQGTLAEVKIPEHVDVPIRKNNLWEETCFEFFLGVEGHDQYREFNLSPAGHWNVFRFESYRQGMQEEIAFVSLPFSVQREPDALLLALEIDLASNIRAEESLEIAVSAVTQLMGERMNYWALVRPCARPDFHHRNSFIVAL